jgi:hypothetical protein
MALGEQRGQRQPHHLGFAEDDGTDPVGELRRDLGETLDVLRR